MLPNQAQIQASLEIVLQKKKENNFLWFCLTKVAGTWDASSWWKSQLPVLLENTDIDDNNHIPTYIFTISPSLMGISVSLKRGEKWQTTWFTEMHVGKAIPNKTITQITKLLKKDKLWMKYINKIGINISNWLQVTQELKIFNGGKPHCPLHFV